jgi:pyruvate kinase
MVTEVNRALQERGLVQVDDYVVIVFGSPIGEVGKTNTLRVHRIRPYDWVETVQVPLYQRQ